jgi:cell division ATPase FtsA
LAEDLKIRIANAPDPEASHPVIDGFEILHEGRSVFVQPVGELTLERLNALIRDEIEGTLAIVDTLIQQAKGQRPDVILLSGQSSRLPIVQELFARRFPAERIYWAGEHRAEGAAPDERNGLKECVVRGACWVAWAQTLPGEVIINDTDMQPMATARIGLMTRNADGQPAFKTVVAAGDPVGIPKPIEDLVMTTRLTRLRVLENTGSSDDLTSPDIEELGTYDIKQRLPPDITNVDMRAARLSMELTRDYEVIIHVQIPNREPFSFTCERWVKE